MTRNFTVNDSWSALLAISPQSGRQTRQVPKLGGGPTKRQKSLFEDAWKELKKRLEDDKCAEALGGRGKVNEITQAIEGGQVPVGLNWNLSGLQEDDLLGSLPSVSAVSYYRTNGKSVTPVKLQLNPFGLFFIEDNSLTVGYDVYDFRQEIVERYFPLPDGYGRLKFESYSQRSAFILLHEIGHLTGMFGRDEDLRTQSRINVNVLENCFTSATTDSEIGPYHNVTTVR